MYRVFQSMHGSALLNRLRVAMGYPVVRSKGRDKEELGTAAASDENLYSFRFVQIQPPLLLAKHFVGFMVQGVVSGPVSRVRRFPNALRGRDDAATRANPSR